MSVKDRKDGFGDDKELAYAQSGEIDENSTDEELLAYTIPPDEQRALLRTLDFHIAPVLMIL
jgi:hypothetical protein